MPFNPLISAQPQTKAILANALTLNDRSPFMAGEPIVVDSLAGTILYGVNAPGDLSVTKYSKVRAVAGQTGFELPATLNTPGNTVGGALAIANQLRVVGLINDITPMARTRGDVDPAAGQFIIAAGGGTMVGDTTMTLNAATAAGLVTFQIKSSGANVKTILSGDRMTITEGAVTETVTVTRLFTANGTTAVSVFTTPTVNAYTIAAVLTFVAATGKAVSIGTAAVAGADYAFWILDAADVVTVGATSLTAGQVYDGVCTDVMTTAGAVNIGKALAH